MITYIATDLTRREIDLSSIDPFADHPDLRIEGRLYRALSPEYYAYLRSRMTRLKTGLDAGQVALDIYRPMADRFNALHADAVGLFGEDALRAAMRSFNPQAYRLPGDDEIVEVSTQPKQAWEGQGTLAGFTASAVLPPDAPVTIGQRIRTFGTEVIITGYHAPDEYFPGGWVDVATDANVAGQVDLRFAKDMHGRDLVPMTLTPDEQRITALPDEQFALTDADLDVSDLPEPHFYPAGDDQALRCYHPVSPRAVESVDAIRERALALGWTEAQLYQNRGRFAYPYGQEYGLVCSLGRGYRIGEMTADAIELVSDKSHAGTLRHYRPKAALAMPLTMEVSR